MNKKLYIGIYAGSFALAFLGMVLLSVFGDRTPAAMAQTVSTIAAVAVLQFLLVLTIYPFILLARIWGAIQDECTTVTPVKAILFQFIPFFNLYWIFRVWGGFATDYDNYVLRHDLDVAPLESYSFMFYPIFAILGGLLLFPVIAVPFIMFPMIGKACDAVNSLRTARVIVWVR